MRLLPPCILLLVASAAISAICQSSSKSNLVSLWKAPYHLEAPRRLSLQKPPILVSGSWDALRTDISLQSKVIQKIKSIHSETSSKRIGSS